MERITVKEAAEKWNITVRRVQDLCKKGLIPDAERFGLNWMVPADAVKPIDGRTKAAKEIKNTDGVFPIQPLIRKIFLKGSFGYVCGYFGRYASRSLCHVEWRYRVMERIKKTHLRSALQKR